MREYCRCEHSLIKCDHLGCLCQMCGLPDDPIGRMRKLDERRPPTDFSYPFLRIAKRHDADYGDVLMAADLLLGGQTPEHLAISATGRLSMACYAEIQTATNAERTRRAS